MIVRGTCYNEHLKMEGVFISKCIVGYSPDINWCNYIVSRREYGEGMRLYKRKTHPGEVQYLSN